MKNISFTIIIIFFTQSIYAQDYFLKAAIIGNTSNSIILDLSIAFSSSGKMGSGNLELRYDQTVFGAANLLDHQMDAPYFNMPTLTQPDEDLLSLNIDLQVPGFGKMIEAYPNWTSLATLEIPLVNANETSIIEWVYNGGTVHTVLFADDEMSLLQVNDPSADLISATYAGALTNLNEQSTSINQFYAKPNPIVDKTIIHIDLEEAMNGNIQLITLLGRVVSKEQMDFKQGENQFELDMSKYPKGVYLLRMEGEEDRMKTIRLLKI